MHRLIIEVPDRVAADTELFKQLMDNESFRRWMTDTVFGLTYEAAEPRGGAAA